MKKASNRKKRKIEDTPPIDFDTLEETEPTPQGVELLENPLPVPKKHIRKKMDYGFEPSQDLLKFDLPIPDYDDFDL
ncbi:MAG: hypothetical protein LBM69_01415 [Lachnospiraceae bacterium]|jgi:hypothetical protein|nr:hypothetical protein [Lachnospiraceae bacterium]